MDSVHRWPYATANDSLLTLSWRDNMMLNLLMLNDSRSSSISSSMLMRRVHDPLRWRSPPFHRVSQPHHAVFACFWTNMVWVPYSLRPSSFSVFFSPLISSPFSPLHKVDIFYVFSKILDCRAWVLARFWPENSASNSRVSTKTRQITTFSKRSEKCTFLLINLAVPDISGRGETNRYPPSLCGLYSSA